MDWQPIETAPKDQDVLVWSHGDASIARGAHGTFLAMADGMPACTSDGRGVFVQPTHWMPIPPAPC